MTEQQVVPAHLSAIPDRLSTRRDSKYYRGENHDCPYELGLEISIDGKEEHGTVVEYCISQGWARRIVLVDGKPVPNLNKTALRTEMVRGEIKVWWKKPT